VLSPRRSSDLARSVYGRVAIACIYPRWRWGWGEVGALECGCWSGGGGSVVIPRLCRWDVMSTHASILVDSVGPPSVEVYRTAASFP
jgi:hypothetical protein